MSRGLPFWILSAVLTGCALTVQGTSPTSPDVPNGDDVTDGGIDVVLTRDTSTSRDSGIDVTLSEPMMAADVFDAGTVDSDGAVGTDVIDVPGDGNPYGDVDIQGTDCNDLFPPPPVHTIYHDVVAPQGLAGGTLRDGLYQLVQYDAYRRNSPTDSPAPPLMAWTIRVQGVRWQLANFFAIHPGLETPEIDRFSGRCATSPSMPLENLHCSLDCPFTSAGPILFVAYAASGDQLLLQAYPDTYTFIRVGDP